MKLSFENEVEQLDYELGYLIDHSKDRKFTGFLYQLRGELCFHPENCQSIRVRAISNYDVYVSNMNSLGKPVEQYYYGAIYKGMDSPTVLNSRPAAAPKPETKPEPVFSQEPVFDAQPEIKSQPESKAQPEIKAQASVTPQPELKPEPEIVLQSEFDSMPDITPEPEIISQSETKVRPEIIPQPETIPQPEIAPQQQFISQPQFNAQQVMNTQPAFAPHPNFHGKAETAPKAEYAVGAIVMSVLGAVFLLTGLVYFAVNFLDTFMQGMLMYLICIGVLAVSELVIRRIVVKLSSVFTAIGISGLFLTTVVNYRALYNISLPACAFILGLCAVLVCLFGYYRKSRLYSAIGFFAAFASSAAIGSDSTPVQYLVITLGTLLISCMWMIFPVDDQYRFADTFMIIAECIYFMIGAGFRIDHDDKLTIMICKYVFILCSWFVSQFIYYSTAKRNILDENAGTGSSVANKIIISVAGFLYVIYLSGGIVYSDFEKSTILLAGLVLYFACVVPAVIFAVKLYQSSNRAWFSFYILIHLAGIIGALSTKNAYVIAIAFALHGLAGRILTAKIPNDYSLKIMDVIIQSIVGVLLVFTSFFFKPAEGEFGLEMYFACVVLSVAFAAGIFITSGYKNVVRIISVFAITVGIMTVFIPNALQAVCGMGIILGFTCLFSFLDRNDQAKDSTFNWFAVAMEFIFLLGTAVANSSYEFADGLIYIIGLLFGLCFIILMLNKDYGMPFAEKYIIIPAYLTFAFIISPLNKAFLLSIILMAVAVASVVFGFILKEKAIRVYGLVLSIIVCAKIAFIDFVTLGDVKSKTVMYIMVGAFALLIGTIYMVLESRETKALAKKNEEQGAS